MVEQPKLSMMKMIDYGEESSCAVVKSREKGG